MITADRLTFQRHWAARRSPAGWAGIWVAGGRQTRAEPQSVVAKTKSSAMFLIPESGDEGGRCRSKRSSTSQHNVVWNQKLSPNSVSSVDSWGPHLQFPPQPTLEAAHTVHDPGDVQEGQSDVLLMLYQQPWKIWKKHNGFTSWTPINPKIYCRWSGYIKMDIWKSYWLSASLLPSHSRRTEMSHQSAAGTIWMRGEEGGEGHN